MYLAKTDLMFRTLLRSWMRSYCYLVVIQIAHCYKLEKTVIVFPHADQLWQRYFSHTDAGGGIRTHEPLRDRVLSPAPLTRLGNSRGAPPPPADLSVARGRPR